RWERSRGAESRAPRSAARPGRPVSPESSSFLRLSRTPPRAPPRRTRTTPPRHPRRASSKAVGGALDDLALSFVCGSLESSRQGEPAHVLHLIVVVVGAPAGCAHQEEVNRLPHQHALPHVHVARVAQGSLYIRTDPRLLANLADRGLLVGLVRLDPALGQPPCEV